MNNYELDNNNKSSFGVPIKVVPTRLKVSERWENQSSFSIANKGNIIKD
jgi:hypothetical protein